MTTIEGNQLIADFMGILYGLKMNATDPVKWETKVRIHPYNGIEGTAGLHINHLKFHSSWEWLMPVVEKIGLITPIELWFTVSPSCHIDKAGIKHAFEESTIKNIWLSCVEFIELNNKSKQ